MNQIVVFGLAAALLATATSGAAQERERRGPQGPRMSSVHVLLDSADELDLSASLRNRRLWGMLFVRAIRTLTASDFNLIEARLRELLAPSD